MTGPDTPQPPCAPLVPCRYFTGVAAVLQSLGIINNNTRLAGSSGGAITAAALCSNIPAATQQFATNINITTTCRANKGCRGILNSVVRSSFSNLLAAGKDSAPKSTRVAADRLPGAATGSSSAVTRPVTGWCGSKLFITVTHARPANATDLPLLVSNFSFVQQLVDAVAASAYLPFLSGASAVTRYDGLTVYDGGFSYPLPCPPGERQVGPWRRRVGVEGIPGGVLCAFVLDRALEEICLLHCCSACMA